MGDNVNISILPVCYLKVDFSLFKSIYDPATKRNDIQTFPRSFFFVRKFFATVRKLIFSRHTNVRQSRGDATLWLIRWIFLMEMWQIWRGKITRNMQRRKSILYERCERADEKLLKRYIFKVASFSRHGRSRGIEIRHENHWRWPFLRRDRSGLSRLIAIY